MYPDDRPCFIARSAVLKKKPVFWNAPTAYMHAATDIGCVVEWVRSHFTLTSDENGCMAVLHNRNKMVTTFGNSEWVTQAEGLVQSKSVTSCAGMTAHLVLLAQTRVGFLSGGRSKHMRDLPPAEFLAQLEEAYARATVALTRAQKLGIIMGPLDMRGLLGAATVIGCLKYGAGVCGLDTGHRTVEMHLREGPDDGSFLASLRRSLANARGVYPPVAFAEIYCEDSRSSAKVRRLHLIVIDLDRSRNVGKQVYWQFQQAHLSARYEECFNTLPVPTTDLDCPHRCRYVYGYGIDGSDQPSSSTLRSLHALLTIHPQTPMDPHPPRGWGQPQDGAHIAYKCESRVDHAHSIVGQSIGDTRTHSPEGAEASMHLALPRGAEVVVHSHSSHSRCGHHVQYRHRMAGPCSSGRYPCRVAPEQRC